MFESNMVDLLESIFGGYKEVSQPSSNKSWWFVTSTENDLKGSNLKFIPLKTNMAIYIYGKTHHVESMYFLWKNSGILKCHVSFQGCDRILFEKF